MGAGKIARERSELARDDAERGWLEDGHYRSDVDLKLPGPDGDRSFVLSQIPGQCGSAALIPIDKLKNGMPLILDGREVASANSTLPMLPSVVCIKQCRQRDTSYKVVLASTAATFGPVNSMGCIGSDEPGQ